MKTCIVVDDVYAFIDGSMACQNGSRSVLESIRYINSQKDLDQVVYVQEYHPKNHCSFLDQGGIWPPHGIGGTRESEIAQEFYLQIQQEKFRPGEENIFRKGENPLVEEYSGYLAKNTNGCLLKDRIGKETVVCGIATEYCVKQTVLDLLDGGFQVSVLEKGLAYIDEEGHKKTLEELKQKGVIIL